MNNDFMHDWTDDKILEIEKTIHKMFKSTRKEIISQFEEINKKVKSYNGDLPQQEVLKLWNKNKMLDKFIKESAIKIKDLNKETIKLIQKELIEIYLANYYFGAYLSELVTNKPLFKDLPNSVVAKKQLEENPNEFTNLKYSEITSYAFILIGLTKMVKTSILKDRNGFKKDMDKYLSKLLNTANTTTETNTSRIEAMGRLEAFKFADSKYTGLKKQWVSTLDMRTRKSHQRVNMEIRDINKKFSNGLMFPCDPAGSAKETVNCRCTIVVINPTMERDGYIQDLDERLTRKQFELWKEEKK